MAPFEFDHRIDPASPAVVGVAASLAHAAAVAGLVLARGTLVGAPPTSRPLEVPVVVGVAIAFSLFLVGLPAATLRGRGYVAPAVVSVVGVALEARLFRAQSTDGEALVRFATLVAPALCVAVLVAVGAELVRDRLGRSEA